MIENPILETNSLRSGSDYINYMEENNKKIKK